MDGTLHREGDRFVLRFERHLSHPVEQVWGAVTEPAQLAAWFPGRVEIDFALGGKVTFANTYFEGDPELLPTRGTVTALDPPRLFAFTWGEDLLRFELSPEGTGCVLVFSHSFANRASAPRSAAGWTVCLGSLVAALDGTLAPGEDWHSLYEHYANEFGTEGIFARNGETAELRFERLLDHPVAEVWDALTRPGRLADWLAETSTVLSEGEPVQLRFATPAGCTVTGTVTRLDAPKVLEYTWTSPGEPDGVVKWQLIGVGASCLLLLTHTVRGHWSEAGTLAAWHVHLSLLENSLSGKATSPFPDRLWQELEASYANTISAESGKVSE
ncbi:MAG: SRPBCC family protein [Acidimicrobiales bacterium]|jgi:uncharacterized protein YndB with AHSA1/START domain